MHYLYIIYSKSTNKYYTGETCDMDTRILKHNNHTYKGSFTKIANDWEVKLLLNCDNINNAKYLISFIKRMKSKKFIKKVIDNPAILIDIINKK